MNEQQIEEIIEQHCNQSSREAHHNAAKQIWKAINAQQQPAAPLSSLPEDDYCDKYEGKAGAMPEEDTVDFLQSKVRTMQAENTRLEEANKNLHSLMVSGEQRGYEKACQAFQETIGNQEMNLAHLAEENTRLREQLQNVHRYASDPSLSNPGAMAEAIRWVIEECEKHGLEEAPAQAAQPVAAEEDAKTKLARLQANYSIEHGSLEAGVHFGNGYKAAQAAQPPAAGEAVALIAAERRRQVEKERWTPEHDDEHTSGEMAIAAACYALHHTDAMVVNPLVDNNIGWPWAEMWWKPSVDKIKNLVRAGALIAAEIDRIRRQDAQTKGGTE